MGNLRAIAMGEMGGRIFDLALEQGQPRILKKPDKMPPNPLLDGVIGDLRHLYATPDFTNATICSNEKSRSGIPAAYLSLRTNNGPISDYYFHDDIHVSGARRELARSLYSDGCRILREVEYLNYRQFAGFVRPIPTRILLRNYRWHYTLEIETLEMMPGAATPPPTEAR